MFSLVCGSIGVTLQVVAQAASPRQFFGATKFERGDPERTHRREADNSVIDKTDAVFGNAGGGKSTLRNRTVGRRGPNRRFGPLVGFPLHK
jgi:hypothetical protein